MNRNSTSHFSATDNRINIGRSKFNRDSWVKTTTNFGDLIPFYVDEVLPGDTFEMKTSLLARMATPLVPVLDNSYLDTYFFFCPTRLLWEHWAEFNGENNVNAWTNMQEYLIPSFPQYYAGGASWSFFSVPDYMGLPVLDEPAESASSVNILPFRAYQLIWNEFFRDQNLQDPVFINTGDTVDFGEWGSLIEVRKVNKFHDYFTSALPAPQKGPSVLIPGLEDVPVVTLNISHSNPAGNYGMRGYYGSQDINGNLFADVNGQVMSDNDTAVGSSGTPFIPSNLYTGEPIGATIDALRTAFQIQKLLWRDGNGGTRYTEILRSHFGVVSPDARLQRPEYLGGKRTPITMNQVIQQSASGENGLGNPSPQGNTAAYSKTVDSFHGFTKSFTEHGYIIGVCCARTDHTYQQGINRLWSRRSRFDFYYPELANIGEQPVLMKEIYSVGDATDDQVFGYQEAWADYRYRPSYVTGAFRSSYPQSLDFWHYADNYKEKPTLSATWIQEDSANVNRTLAVEGNEARHEQLLIDFYFDLKCTRPMPVYSIPGLVDHF